MQIVPRIILWCTLFYVLPITAVYPQNYRIMETDSFLLTEAIQWQTISTSQLPSHLNSKRGGGGGGSWWETGADRPEPVAGGAAGAGATLAHTLVTSARTAPALLPFRCEAQQAAGPYFPAKPGHDRAASEGPWKWAPTCGLTLWLHTVVLWLSRANKAPMLSVKIEIDS